LINDSEIIQTNSEIGPIAASDTKNLESISSNKNQIPKQDKIAEKTKKTKQDSSQNHVKEQKDKVKGQMKAPKVEDTTEIIKNFNKLMEKLKNTDKKDIFKVLRRIP
jgi:hypothetical protein